MPSIEITCVFCSKKRMETTYRIRKGYGKYCSHECYMKFWKANPPKSFVNRTPEQIQKFREMAVSNKGKKVPFKERPKMKGRWLGEKNPLWKGGITLKDNRKYKSVLQANRRALKRKAIGNFTLQDWIEIKTMHAYLCGICGDIEPNIKLTIDHIIPLSKGGSNERSNIQPLCGHCNSTKNAKIL